MYRNLCYQRHGRRFGDFLGLVPKMNPETIIHLSIVKYLTLLENQRRLFFFHPANGGARTAREAKKAP